MLWCCCSPPASKKINFNFWEVFTRFCAYPTRENADFFDSGYRRIPTHPDLPLACPMPAVSRVLAAGFVAIIFPRSKRTKKLELANKQKKFNWRAAQSKNQVPAQKPIYLCVFCSASLCGCFFFFNSPQLRDGFYALGPPFWFSFPPPPPPPPKKKKKKKKNHKKKLFFNLKKKQQQNPPHQQANNKIALTSSV